MEAIVGGKILQNVVAGRQAFQPVESEQLTGEVAYAKTRRRRGPDPLLIHGWPGTRGLKNDDNRYKTHLKPPCGAEVMGKIGKSATRTA